MVKICSMTNYSNDSEILYKAHFDKYPYPLSIFQKYAIEAIVKEQHVLITAHTGSGKTLPAEFAIEYFVSMGKKVIYTGPIKSLINQKFYDFTHKYPHISFGILTGDVKFNPDADVLIMTAEILLNKLYKNNIVINNSINDLSFDMNLQTELGCVIMDEVHYINDKDRGHVWENTIMLLPKHVPMVMLSATIDNPENFAYWCENIHESNNKIVYLTNTNYRVVPLTHYSFITITQSIFKKVKDKSIQEEIKKSTNKLFILQNSNGIFKDENYFNMNKMLKLFDLNDIRVKRQNVLNQVTKHMVENEMLPALCFVLSRKQLEQCATELTTDLLEFDSKVPYTIDRECEQIIRQLPNYKEYLNLPEYTNIISLLRKGVAIHHSGIMPIFKEMIELLYAKGFIKILFATETFSVGVNMPTKTVLFMDAYKFDGNNNRILHSHEYTQMAGRAGRRNIDTVGHVIHLNNLFHNIEIADYKIMMNGKPPILTSKFKLSFNLILNLINENTNILHFAKKSMITNELNLQLNEILNQSAKLQTELDIINNKLNGLTIPETIMREYIDLTNHSKYAVNKTRKQIDKQLATYKETYITIDKDKSFLERKIWILNELRDLETKHNNIKLSVNVDLNKVMLLLENNKFIIKTCNTTNDYAILPLGQFASNLREIHPLVFAELIEKRTFNDLSSKQLVGLFSCFTNIVIPDDLKDINPIMKDKVFETKLKLIIEMYKTYENTEFDYEINTGTDYYYHFDLIPFVIEWCECTDENQCKLLLYKLEQDKQLFLGEFVKALLKINSISNELEKLAEINNDIDLLEKLKQISPMILKFVVTNQSLYI
jgi:antiviral helicase SKI2